MTGSTSQLLQELIEIVDKRFGKYHDVGTTDLLDAKVDIATALLRFTETRPAPGVNQLYVRNPTGGTP